MEDSSRPGRDQAREYVESISKELGFLPDNIWASLAPEAREAISYALQRKDDMLFKMVYTLAKNLYTSSARFVFELLQNADDNHFEKAKAQSQSPYVSFCLYKDRIIVDCNEDGFTRANLWAISTVGESSKVGAQGYIGEKGIGFKSVFMAAWKVTIQSGDFSFFFKHRRNDTGLGMIHPRWIEPEETLPENLTRMTLLLHDDGDANALASQREMIRRQLNDLQESLLLFTQNLKEIRVAFYDDQGRLEKRVNFSTSTIDFNQRFLVTRTHDGRKGKEVIESQIYHTATQVASNLAKNDNRTYSEYEEKTKAYSTSKVVLGFPISNHSVPVEAYQSVYAFLPMKQAGFKFLIQGDFVTQANRQDLVSTSQRNLDILETVASTFVQAVQEFCKHPKLKYTWMRFLPDSRTAFFDGFWSRLIKIIAIKLETTPVLVSRRRPGTLDYIKNLRRYSDDLLDDEGNPLFKDVRSARCISENYSESDLDRLTPHGLHFLSADETLDLVERDLGLKDESRIKTNIMPEKWHQRVAAFLLSIASKPESRLLRRLRSFPILPLQGGGWAAPDSGNIYFGQASSCSENIPRSIGLRLLEPPRAMDSNQKEFYRSVGVRAAAVKLVRDAIFETQRIGFNPAVMPYIAQLRYLYMTHHLVQQPAKNPRVKVFTHLGTPKSPLQDDIYLVKDNGYGASSLLRGKDAESEEIKLHFLDALYENQVIAKPAGAAKTWEQWLVSYVGIRKFVRLAAPPKEPMDLSKELQFVAKHHPDSLPGFLRYNWRTEGNQIKSSPDLIEKAQQLEVICEGGQKRQLSDTYLPFIDLQEECLKFMKDSKDFPFLDLREVLERGSYLHDWGFLVDVLGVGIDADLKFYQHILSSMACKEDAIESPHRVLKAYSTMYGIFTRSHHQRSTRTEISRFFADQPRIMSSLGIPDEDLKWALTKDCIWDAPATFLTKFPIRSRYAQFLGKDEGEIDDSDIGRMFRRVVEVPLLDWRAIVQELGHRSYYHCMEYVDGIPDLYSRLERARASLSKRHADELRFMFQTQYLILTDDKDIGWANVSECLWSTSSRFLGRAALSDIYGTLEAFFVDFLGVERLNAQIVYNELITQKRSSTAEGIRRLKSQLKALGGFVPELEEDPAFDPFSLTKDGNQIFPVKLPGHTKAKLVPNTTEFFIVDRVHLGRYFTDKVTTLDFDIDEVRELSPLFRWLGLESRYLSKSVREITGLEGADAQLVPRSGCRIRRRSKALCRVAYHFNSPRLDGKSVTHLLDILESSKIYETDGITSELHLSQDGEVHVHMVGSSNLHIRGTSSMLEIWVPRNRRRRGLCYASKLPSELFDWLMTDPLTRIPREIEGSDKGRRLVAIILSLPPSEISEILEQEGIVSAGIDMEVEGEDDEDDESSTHGGVRSDAPGAGTEAETQSSTTRAEDTTHQASDDERAAQQPSRSSRPSEPRDRTTVTTDTISRTGALVTAFPLRRNPVQVPEQIDQNTYQRLLEKVVAAARRVNLPARSATDLGDDMEGPDIGIEDAIHDTMSMAGQFRASSQFERDCMVGAAGELYVFELLKSFSPQLASFDLSNWQSTIRHLVRPHPDYSRITRWPGNRETADIVYHDQSSAFTRRLMERGYLDASWDGCTPNYLLEVKTTTGSCETAFFMSDPQYRRMHTYRNSWETVYIICRVFHLGHRRVRLRLYVDPAELEARGELIFTSGTWSVVPGPVGNI